MVASCIESIRISSPTVAYVLVWVSYEERVVLSGPTCSGGLMITAAMLKIRLTIAS